MSQVLALTLSVTPCAMIASGIPIPKSVDESGSGGALAGDTVEVVKCETNDLLVPACAEMVFEGSVSITDTTTEGKQSIRYETLLLVADPL